MRHEFHPEALAELEDASDYYFSRQEGLQHRFLDAVQSAINEVSEDPLRWRKFVGDIRRYLVHIFPYAVLYSIEEDRLYIIAVMHCSHEPNYWKSRRSQT